MSLLPARVSRDGSDRHLYLSVFQRSIHILCYGEAVYELLMAGYGHLAIPRGDVPDIAYTVGPADVDPGYWLTRAGQAQIDARDVSEFLYFFEKDLTIELQRRRPDLYFIHAAAVELDGKAAIIVAPSGTGKSTTTWGLLHAGLRYLSDELAPVDLDTMTVHPYPHALCLKNEPPGPYSLPLGTLRTAETLHVPVEFLPAEAALLPTALVQTIFLKRDVSLDHPGIREINAGEAAARLLANALNPLAHRGDGLDAAIEIARHTHSVELQVAGLAETCEAIRIILGASNHGPS